MKILFIGLGSIGQRHLRNIKTLKPGNDVQLLAYRKSKHKLVIDNGESITCESLADHYNIIELENLQDALNEHADIVFICGPSAQHISMATIFAKNGCHLFIEKPLATDKDNVRELEVLLKRNDLIHMVGFQFRFHPCVQKIASILTNKEFGDVISTQFDWSTFLPSAHPYEDYRQGYAASRKLGGGVVFSLCHELDLIQYFFGLPQSVYAIGGYLSSLEMDTDDTVAALFRCGTKTRSFPVQLHLSFAQGKEQRTIKILMEKAVLTCNLLTANIEIVPHQQRTITTQHFPKLLRNDLFISEVQHFFDCVTHHRCTQIPVEEGKKSSLMALAIHKSLQSEKPEIIATL